MPDTPYSPGQRWVSDSEPELGLGMVLEGDRRRITLAFQASGEKRTYAIDNAPLSRVMFTVGEQVEDEAGRLFRIDSVQQLNELLIYSVTDDEEQQRLLPETELASSLQFSRPQQRLFNGQFDKPHWFALRHATLLHQQQLQQSPLRGLAGARTQLLPHQLYIAHEVGRRPLPRVLLADEVGLGKTIEACLILHSKLLTGSASRVLIVVPTALLNQWLVELLRRFNLHFSLFDQERCEAIITSDTNDNPFLSEQLVLCDLPLLTARHEQLVNAGWDLLIVDEAHHLEWHPDHVSEQYRAVEALAAQVPGVLLLTATPEQLGRAGHFARLRLLDPDRFPDLDAFIDEQQRFQPIAETADRLLSGQPLDPQTVEHLAELLSAETAEPLLAALTGGDDSARDQLVSLLIDQHGTSRVLLRNTRSRIQGFPERLLHHYPLPFPSGYDQPAQLTPEADHPNQGRGAWWRFDPRIDWLTQLLSRLDGDKMLLICARSETAMALGKALRQLHGIHAGLFHEHMSIIERDRAAVWFADPDEGCQLLICSEIGSEGRNFQFAHHLALFDLPLDPDLLEQRIGRLDRIGQRDTIEIHVPWFIETAQAVLLRWYRDGLNGFLSNSAASHSIFSQLRPALLQALEAPSEDPAAVDALISAAAQLHHSAGKQLQRGRDHLLELSSCRQPQADQLCQQLLEQESDRQLPGYLEQLLSAYGVESEEHSIGNRILRPGQQMLTDSFPNLPPEGLTCTFERSIALTHEQRHFITWEHPLLLDGMEMLCSSIHGSSSAIAVQAPQLKSGGLLLELLFVIECPAPRRLQLGRFLPPTLIRLLLDPQLNELGERLTRDDLAALRLPLKRSAGASISRALRSQIEAMLSAGEQLAEQRRTPLVAQAQQRMETQYRQEIDRLSALQRVNPNVRNAEIDALRQQQLELQQHLHSTRLRLDALQLVVTL